MNAAEFANEIAKQKGISRRQSYLSVNVGMDTLRLVLSKGESVEIGGFGTFQVLIDMKGERIPTFKGGRAMKRVLNTYNGEDTD